MRRYRHDFDPRGHLFSPGGGNRGAGCGLHEGGAATAGALFDVGDGQGTAANGDAQAWYDALVAAKGGNADAIVFLAITEPFVGCDPLLGCAGSLVYDELVMNFGDKGRVQDIESADYVPSFQEAVGLISSTCDDFVPEG